MACYHPHHVYQQVNPAPSGKRPVSFNVAKCVGNPLYVPITLPCGVCAGCKFERSRQWAIRCMHEASLHTCNCVVTLTYDNDHLPPDGSLIKRDVQLWLKRLRKRYPDYPIQYYYCGEYGARFGRPHYHICLFGFDFVDRVLYKRTGAGSLIYRSAILESLWTAGYSTVGDLTYESAAYVARYILKKQFGAKSIDHYNLIDYTTGEVIESKLPEYNNMSLKRPIGQGWIDAHLQSVYNIDAVMVRNHKGRLVRNKPPRYYDGRYELYYPDELRIIKERRREAASLLEHDNTPDRLATKERYLTLTILQQLRRDYENDTTTL